MRNETRETWSGANGTTVMITARELGLGRIYGTGMPGVNGAAAGWQRGGELDRGESAAATENPRRC
jgi:hypothetical protein